VRGQAPVARFTRLVADLPEQRAGAEVSWSVGGETDSLGRAWLRVAARADLVVRCQRCMQPFVLAVQAGNTLQMMKSEAALDAAEEVDETDEEGYTERIVGSPRLDLLARSMPGVAGSVRGFRRRPDQAIAFRRAGQAKERLI
jgi:uncharacterized protein